MAVGIGGDREAETGDAKEEVIGAKHLVDIGRRKKSYASNSLPKTPRGILRVVPFVLLRSEVKQIEVLGARSQSSSASNVVRKAIIRLIALTLLSATPVKILDTSRLIAP
jgi:hypothetical protein